MHLYAQCICMHSAFVLGNNHKTNLMQIRIERDTKKAEVEDEDRGTLA